jgi:ElaB/YqjD/DUF883 family membrane-anchored ribosome-binding protein
MNDATHESAHSADETLAKRLEKDLKAVKNDIAHLSEQIVDAVNAIKAAAQTEGSRGLKRTRASVDQAMSGASERAGALAEAAQGTASSLADRLGDAIEDRPVAAVAIAFGVGYLVGLSRRR